MAALNAFRPFMAILVFVLIVGCTQDKKSTGQKEKIEQPEELSDEKEYGLKLYGIKSGIIEYKHSGARTGTSIMYFDKYGHRSANYSDLVMNNQPDKGWVISFDEMQYMFKEGNKQGAKMKNPMIEGLKKVNDLEKFVEDMYDKMGFKRAGTEKFLGKECRVFKGDMGKVLLWNGILMLMDMNTGMMTMKQEATSIEVNVKVKPSVFELPADIVFSEIPVY